jgi:D-3-phosphoglycerate dehydrogenase
LEELFAASDYVVLSCPLTPQTERMVNARLLSHMKPSAYLINAARGKLIDEAAFVPFMRERRIPGAALDVFTEQPLRRDHALYDLPNVLLTPHLASLTLDSMKRIGRISCEEIVRLLCGERPINLANPDIWTAAQERWRTFDSVR